MYNVGQVLYVILEKKRVILPVRVSEQIVRRSASGESITYRVEVPGTDQPAVSLSSLSNSHFSSLEDVKSELLSNAEKMILSMTERASSVASEFFGDPTEEKNEDLNISSPLEAETMKVDLGEGLVGKVDLSGLEKGEVL